VTPPLSIPIFSAPGKTNVSDSDFFDVPPDGTMAIARNSSSGAAVFATRVNGVWKDANLT